tara:strand:+ start:8465 stop:10702 length:2238 start_codon:yes stop_codon:yes gene_type:complete
MKNHPIKVKKILTSFGFFSLIVISNNSELNAKYNYNSNKFQNKKFNNLKSSNYQINSSSFNSEYDFNKDDNFKNQNFQIAKEDKKDTSNVLISEIIIKGWADHPEGRKLELAAYDSMTIKPGTLVNNAKLKKDLNAIYLTGLFSGVKFQTEEGPLGIRLIVIVIPNPILKDVKITPSKVMIPEEYLNNIFQKYYGKTLNLNILQDKINDLKKWYENKGYSLARINGPDRISEDGIVQLKIDEGIVSKVDLRFIGTDEKVRKGKTKNWVIKRQLKTTPKSIFNRKILEEDIKRLYSTSLFNDIKVSLGPDKLNPGQVIITLDISEQKTGSLTGGIGFSNNAGVFAQAGFQESNTLGRQWSTNLNLNFGEYSTTYNFSIYDPWIKGDKHKTSFRTNVFLSRDYPQEFKSESNGRLIGVKDLYQAPGTVVAHEISSRSYSSVSEAKSADSTRSWFDYEGASVVLENIGGGFSFARPLNGGDPFKSSPWRILGGMNFKKVMIMDSSGHKRPYATVAYEPTTLNVHEIICVGYETKDGSCPSENKLISFIATASRNKVNNSANPTSGNVFNVATEQFISVGNDSPTFNRMRSSYAWFIPTNLLNLTKGCKSGKADSKDCPQTLAFQVKTGTIIGELPPYESFCLGGSSSVRGWGNCQLGVSRTFAEATAEYRFPVWRMISAALFADAGSDLGTQNDVPGKPGKLLKKPGSGFSLGGGIGIKTPVGPIRLDAASQDLSGNMRYTLGVGWKF